MEKVSIIKAGSNVGTPVEPNGKILKSVTLPRNRRNKHIELNSDNVQFEISRNGIYWQKLTQAVDLKKDKGRVFEFTDPTYGVNVEETRAVLLVRPVLNGTELADRKITLSFFDK